MSLFLSLHKNTEPSAIVNRRITLSSTIQIFQIFDTQSTFFITSRVIGPIRSTITNRDSNMMRLATTILAVLATSSLSDAAPIDTSDNAALIPRGTDYYSGSINFFSRLDCYNTCYKNHDEAGCVSDKLKLTGDLDSPGQWLSKDFKSGKDKCWDIPTGMQSIGLADERGNRYVGIDITCAEWKAGKAFERLGLTAGKGSGWDFADQLCNFGGGLDDGIKAIFYDYA